MPSQAAGVLSVAFVCYVVIGHYLLPSSAARRRVVRPLEHNSQLFLEFRRCSGNGPSLGPAIVKLIYDFLL